MNIAGMILEILIGGFLSLIWLTLIILTVFGYDWILTSKVENLWNLIIFVTVIISYILGVIFDRIWDSLSLFKKRDKAIWKEYFGDISESKLNTIRTHIFSKNEQSAKFLDYIRNRMRIARASFWNFFFITLSSLAFLSIRIWQKDFYNKLFWFTVICGTGMSLFALYSWRELINTYYKQLASFDKRKNTIILKK